MSRTCEISIRRSRGRHSQDIHSNSHACIVWAQKGDSSTAWRTQKRQPVEAAFLPRSVWRLRACYEVFLS